MTTKPQPHSDAGSSHARRLVSAARAEADPAEDRPITAQEWREKVMADNEASRLQILKLREGYNQHREELRRMEKESNQTTT